jgi:hypothetical protein
VPVPEAANWLITLLEVSMHSVIQAGALFTVAAVALAGAGCSTQQTAPALFAIGGTYTGTLTYRMTGLPSASSPIAPAITIQMSDPDANGNISGSFTLGQGFTGTGAIAAVYSASVINWQQFGDPGKPLFYIGTLLAASYPGCNFASATFVLGEGNGGGFDGMGHLDLGGTYSGITCTTGTPGDSVATMMTANLVAFNPSPR